MKPKKPASVAAAEKGIRFRIHDLKMSLEEAQETLSAIRYAIAGQSSEEAGAARLTAVADMVQQAVEECRRIHGALRPARLGYGGVVAALQSLCGELREAIPQVTTEEQLNVVEADLPEDLKVVIYRICQEALRNAIEHSGAGRVTLSLGIAGGVIDLSIRDNGHGFDPGHLPLREGDGRGVGLVSMRERADMSGGLFSIQSKPGAEAAVTVQWRLQSRAAP